MKKLICLFLLCTTPLMGQSFLIKKEHHCFHNQVERYIKDLKKDEKIVEIKLRQCGTFDWFQITWFERVEIDV